MYNRIESVTLLALIIRDEIDKQAEQEAKALRKQGRQDNTNTSRLRIEKDYNLAEFNKLFSTNQT